jgi:outer membrane receptor protein involved in Fe transport
MSQAKIRRFRLVPAFTCLLLAAFTAPAAGQDTGRIEGRVMRDVDGEPVAGVNVIVRGTGIGTVTGVDGSFVLARVPVGPQELAFRWLGYRQQNLSVTVRAGATERADVRLTLQAVQLGDVVVSSASRSPERVVEAPSAVSLIGRITLRNQAPTGQAPRALAQVPGVDIVQSGVNDFNVNARGFNSSLNRRVLVLQDGRDLAIAFLGSQEWNAMSIPLDDIDRMEMVRGPGSALYGANAFAGVLDIRTPTARNALGTKLNLAGGELTTFRGDLRHGGLTQDGRFGYRLNVGYSQSESWTRTRTALDGSDAAAEYCDAATASAADCTEIAVEPVLTGVPSCVTAPPNCLSFEQRALSGQTVDGTTGVASGEADDLRNIYGSGRFDFYMDNGSIFTAEGGAAQVENEVFVTGIGRVQVAKALRPWAKLGWTADNFDLMGWYSGRSSSDPQVSLGTGADLEESSAIFHFEGQYNRSLANDQARVVLGASYRNYNVDTKQTLMNAANDDRSDGYYSAYGQFEYEPIPQLRFVAAARVDDGTLFETQFSPKGAIVYSPDDNHSIRASVNRAFQTPNYSEFFLNVQSGVSASPASLEGGLLQYYATLQDPLVVGPTLAAAMSSLGLPSTLPWNFDAQTPVMALGNANLDVEKVTGWEVGYKGNIADNAYVSVDFYYNQLSNFVTDLLFGANPTQFPQFDMGAGTNVLTELATIDAILAGAMLPANHPLRATNTALLDGYNTLANNPALTNLAGVGRAIYLSYAQAGEVDETGVEVGIGYGFTPEFRVDGTYTYFEFDVQDPGAVAAGQTIVPNTPRHKGTIGLTYTGLQGFDAAVNARFVEEHDWSAGVFAGRVPASQNVDVNVGYRFNNNFRAYVNATNLLDQKRFQLYGGSIIQRRLLGGVTTTF